VAGCQSLQRYLGLADHFTPFRRFIDDEFLELGGRHRRWHAAEFGKTCLDLSVGESSVYFLVERDDDFGGRVFGRTDALPRVCLEAWEPPAATSSFNCIIPGNLWVIRKSTIHFR
jgi:hypothetical protein